MSEATVTESDRLQSQEQVRAKIPPHTLCLEVRREMLQESAGIWEGRTDLDWLKARWHPSGIQSVYVPTEASTTPRYWQRSLRARLMDLWSTIKERSQ